MRKPIYSDKIEILIFAMRLNGFSIIETIKFIKNNFDSDLANSKKLVHNSDAWSDKYEENELFHDSIIDAINKIKEEN